MTPAAVKICGITRAEDARLAASLGARAIGFVLWSGSPRHVTIDAAAAIAARLPASVTRVGVFVNAPPAIVTAAARAIGLDVVQLHGDESVEDYALVGPRLVKAVTLATDASVSVAGGLPAAVTPLVDAGTPDARGGTGRLADWTRAAALAGRRPIWLAGGLGDANVGEAIRRVRPALVDVSSGVESAPGVKDPDRLRALFDAVTRAGREEP